MQRENVRSMKTLGRKAVAILLLLAMMFTLLPQFTSPAFGAEVYEATEFANIEEGNSSANGQTVAYGIWEGTEDKFYIAIARFDLYGITSGHLFSDVSEHWAYSYINVAVNNGWILGYEDGTFRPNRNITRAEIMTLANRVLQRIPENTGDLLGGMIKWSDNMDTSKWYYLAVQEATNTHKYDRKPNGFEYWTLLTESPDWTQLQK